MGLDGVCGQTDELGSTLGELRLKLGEGTQLGGANGCEVLQFWSLANVVWFYMRSKHTLGVREENNPAVTNELVELDATL